jgi:hypothetical protein
MSSPTPPDLPGETRASPARKIKPLVGILVGIGLLLICVTLTVGFFAVRAVKNAGLAFRFDPVKKTLVVIGGDGKEFKVSATGDRPRAQPRIDTDPSQGMAAEALPLENWRIDRKVPGCRDVADGCDHTEFTYVEVVGGPTAARERVNAAIAACVTDPNAVIAAASDSGAVAEAAWEDREKKLAPESSLQDLIYARLRETALQDFDIERDPKAAPFFQTSTSAVSVAVLRNAAPVFSLECGLSFSGGMHPMSSSRYLNFDPATGEEIKLASILKDGVIARLTAIAEVHFRQTRNLAATANLNDWGFGFPDGRFALNDNYGFGENAMYFFFNEYEIGPHTVGATSVEIPYAEIRDLIRPGIPL